MTNEDPFSDYLTKQEFCALVPGGPISERTADRWHTLRVGPPRSKIGRTVVYSRQAVRQWLNRRADECERGGGR